MCSMWYRPLAAASLAAAVWFAAGHGLAVGDEPSLISVISETGDPVAAGDVVRLLSDTTEVRRAPTLAPQRAATRAEESSPSSVPKATAATRVEIAPLSGPADSSAKSSEPPTATKPSIEGPRSPDSTPPAGVPKSILQVLPAERLEGSPAEKTPSVGNEKAPVTRNEKAPVAGKNVGDKSLRPIPDDTPSGPAEIETASFSGVTPGVSTIDDVKQKWGAPKEMKRMNGATVQLYAVEPFDKVEAIFVDGKVTSIVIRLNTAFPADGVATQLGLAKLQPIMVSNEMGEILGQSYPERGVVFSFTRSDAPGKATMKVAQIILEPVTAEAFLLRAQTNLDVQGEASLADLDQAIKLAPRNGRAHWLKARALVLSGATRKAAASASEAVRLEPDNPQYRLTSAEILGQIGRTTEAVEEAEKAVATSDKRPHVKARAQCVLGDLAGSGPQPDFRRAMQYHSQAIKSAEAIIADPHPAIRQPAKEVLVDAHLGAANDIAWGSWNNKETSIPVWLTRASDFAEELIQNDGGNSELRLRVATRALATCVGAQGKVDPSPWAAQAIRVGQELVASASTPSQKQRIQRELGLTLYDAMQVDQMRKDHQSALTHGQQAIGYLETLGSAKDRSADAYLLGRLYFRVGFLRSNVEKDHRGAVEWFDKAIAMLQQTVPQLAPLERGRLGETFVSMSVSYWEAGQQAKAVKVSQQGVEFMEKAVQDGLLPQKILDVPYSNLATMHRKLGQDDQARRYAERIHVQPDAMKR